MPKERPILFSDEMVRALLANRKTQTRRIAKFKPYEPGLNLDFTGLELGYYFTDLPRSGYVLRSRGAGGCWNDRTKPLHCPYGQVGDRLWVKEAWTPDHAAFYPCFPLVYRADFGQPYDRNERCEVYSSEQKDWYPFRWRPSLFMQRHNSRLVLEIIATRIERLHAITSQDAWAEGVRCECMSPVPMCKGNIDAYQKLWDKINTKPKHTRRTCKKPKPDHSWGTNPFVWVIEFKRVEGEVAHG